MAIDGVVVRLLVWYSKFSVPAVCYYAIRLELLYFSILCRRNILSGTDLIELEMIHLVEQQ